GTREPSGRIQKSPPGVWRPKSVPRGGVPWKSKWLGTELSLLICEASASSCCSSVLRMLSTRLLRTSRTSTNDATPSATANNPATTMVMRQRTERRRIMRARSFRTESVTRAAHGADQLAVERLVDLAAEVPDVDLHHVRVAGEVHTPDVVEDLALRRDVAVAP